MSFFLGGSPLTDTFVTCAFVNLCWVCTLAALQIDTMKLSAKLSLMELTWVMMLRYVQTPVKVQQVHLNSAFPRPGPFTVWALGQQSVSHIHRATTSNSTRERCMCIGARAIFTPVTTTWGGGGMTRILRDKLNLIFCHVTSYATLRDNLSM